jgi:2-methylisocitrate lyase-like PEP mutase family enzyme
MPKRCGQNGNLAIADFETSCVRIQAAVAAGNEAGVEIIARTDAAKVHNVDDAILRANTYLKLGACAAFVNGIHDWKEIGLLPQKVHGPLIINAASLLKTDNITTSDLSNIGYSGVIYPADSFFAAQTAASSRLNELLDPQYSQQPDAIGSKQVDELVQKNAIWDK